MAGSDGYPLFVGALPEDITEEELRTVFKTYGEVKRIKILTDSDRNPSGNAVVFYTTKKAAEDAITVLHKAYKIREGADHPIRVSWAVRGKASAGAGASRGAPRVEEERERERPVLRERDRRAHLPPERERDSSRGSRSRGRCLAREPERDLDRYGGDRDRGGDSDGPARRAWSRRPRECEEEWDRNWGGGGGGKNWQRNWGWGKGRGKGGGGDADGREWQGGPRGKGEGGHHKGEGGRNSAKGDKSRGRRGSERTNRVYVENLPNDITEQALQRVFTPYGKVLGMHIMPARGRGKACAIIRYGSPGAGSAAIEGLHDKYEASTDTGLLSVKFAKPNPRWEPY